MKHLFYIGGMILLSSLFGKSVSAQEFRLEGKIADLSHGKVILEDLSGKSVLQTQMEQGNFSLQGNDWKKGIYFLHIGHGFKMPLFCEGTQGVVEGYLDPDHPTTDEIIIKNSPLHTRYQDLCHQIHQEEQHYQQMLQQKISSAKSEEEKNKWLGLYNEQYAYLADYTKQIVEKEDDPYVAATIAYAFPGKYYEDAEKVYNALPNEGKNSLPGKLLAKIMKKRFSLANGQMAPPFELVNLKGGNNTLDDFKGKIVVLDFWASWCGPCRAELQYLKSYYETIKDKNVVFISISLDDTREAWEKAVREEQIPWVNLWESKGFKNSPLKNTYFFRQIPYIVIIDAEGKIAGKNLRRDGLANKLNELLNIK